MTSGDRTRAVAVNTMTQVAGKLIGFFISSFFLIILAGELGTNGLGVYTTVIAFVAFFVNLSDLGINLVMMREIAQNPERREEITAEFLGFRSIYALAILALAPLIASFIPQYHTLIRQGIAVAALTQFILMINQTFVSVLQVGLRLERAVIGEIANRLLTLTLAIVGAQYLTRANEFYYYILWVTALAALVNAAIGFYFANQLWKIRLKLALTRLGPILKLVLPMGIFGFLSMMHLKADTVMISLLKTDYDVGIYGYAYKIAEILFSLPLMFVGIVFPQMSALYKLNYSGFLKFTQRAFRVLLVTAFPFMVGSYLLAPYLTTLLSRQSLTDGLIAGQVLQILSLTLGFWFFGSLFQHVLLSATKYRGLIVYTALAVAVNLVLNALLIPRYSYFAAAAVTVISGLIMMTMTGFYAWRLTGFKPKLDDLGRVLFASLIMGGGILITQKLVGFPLAEFSQASRLIQLTYLLTLTTLGGIVYLASLYLAGGRAIVEVAKGLIKHSDG